jgi:superfamily II DNA or RNA helicase
MQQLLKAEIPAETLQKIRDELTFVEEVVKAPRGRRPIAPKSYRAFAENLEFLRVPKFYKLPKPHPAVTYVPRLSVGFTKRFTTDLAGPDSTALRPLQRQAVEAVLAALSGANDKKARGAVLQLPCGYGKTRCAAFVIRNVGVVALVLVANKDLAQQFERALRDLSSDIVTAKLPKPTVPLPDAHVIFGTLQSVYTRRYPAEYLAPVGLVVVDEAHHLAAASFAQAMCSLGSARVLGLTATPERRDGRENLIYCLAGSTVFRHDRPLMPNLEVERLQYSVPPGFGNKPYSSIGERMQLLVCLSEIEGRNRVIVEAIVRYQEDRSRLGILVLAKLQTHLHCLAESLSSECPDAEWGFFTGAESQAVRDASSQRRVIFATYDMAKEGLDIPRLDTLVLASPAESLVQCVGRVLREFPGKGSPVVVDLDDRFRAFVYETASRVRKLEKMRFKK